tara:strand:+ start:26264 stop:26536 length:273 start_codon:yes stop_codon:yes gene_type:complete
MVWNIIVTDTFSKEFKRYKKDKNFMNILDKKIKRLQENPENVGGWLSGKLHGYKSTRIMGKLRLLFRINYDNYSVYLGAIDHRKFDYMRF